MRRNKPYFSDYWLPIQTPNGIWWMLKGHFLYLHSNKRRQFCVVVKGHRLSFGFGSRG